MTIESREQDPGSARASRKSRGMTSHSIEGLSDGASELARACAHIGWQDVRLAAGEGKLSASDVLIAVNAILKRRFEDGVATLYAAPERVEVGGMDSASQSQPCAEKGPQPFSHDAPLSDGKGA